MDTLADHEYAKRRAERFSDDWTEMVNRKEREIQSLVSVATASECLLDDIWELANCLGDPEFIAPRKDHVEKILRKATLTLYLIDQWKQNMPEGKIR